MYRFVVETGATGILLRSREATVPLAINDELKIGRLQAGMVPDTMKAIVSNHSGAGVTASALPTQTAWTARNCLSRPPTSARASS